MRSHSLPHFVTLSPLPDPVNRHWREVTAGAGARCAWSAKCRRKGTEVRIERAEPIFWLCPVR